MMDRRAMGDAALALQSLLRAHPSIWTFLDCNETKLYEFQGDWIECILSRARVTGSAIESDVQDDRNKCHMAVVEFGDCWERLMHYFNHIYVPTWRRPPTYNVVDAYFHELGPARSSMSVQLQATR